MIIKLQIDYNTTWGQTLHVCLADGSSSQCDEDLSIEMSYLSPSKWSVELNLEEGRSELRYRYLVKEGGQVVHREWGAPHMVSIGERKTILVDDIWQNVPAQQYFHTSCFSESFFYHNEESNLKYYKDTILINVYCHYVKKSQILVLCGSSDMFGRWDEKKALPFKLVRYGVWQLSLDASQITEAQAYKLAIYDKERQEIVYWEEGENRVLNSLLPSEKGNVVKQVSIDFRRSWMNWKAAGVAIPVFSLRSDESFGIGEFSDLKKMIDWAAMTGQKVIQVLPINDTTITFSWRDSYPYNAISIFALHPIYLGLNQFPLKHKVLYKKYKNEAAELNKLATVDYEKVMTLKLSYLKTLFEESGVNILNSPECRTFIEKNEDWLFPYACFCHFRDKNKTADYSAWKTYNTFDRKKLKGYINRNAEAKSDVDQVYFVQYLLHKQLTEAKDYAHEHEVILKGDIPIGINRKSVEAWTDPHLFNLDVQAGAPPDDFSQFGQNWGFPTYNWDEMAKDGYQWWIRRFKKMADYFDAYRIDHILGFFRIWEIPQTSVQGILGYFSPALPLTIDEIQAYGILLDIDRMLKPYIHHSFLKDVFGDYVDEVVDKYLIPIGNQRYELKDEYDTQLKVKNVFGSCCDEKSQYIRNGLYSLCYEVLFLRDKNDTDKLHPRITVQHSYSFKALDEKTRTSFNNLYEEFFYKRHSQYWREQAMEKLPTLISSTSMLVCGEDLGMVPESVPSVMHDLQILSLEIERMPKEWGLQFGCLSILPYLSVCTTSTHDMSPVRLWWKENAKATQQYYNHVLGREGVALGDCTSDICRQIVDNHLHSPAMLTILPLQDWLSIDDELKRSNPEEERINIPSNPDHYWQYRMHLTLDKLIHSAIFNERVRASIEASQRL